LLPAVTPASTIASIASISTTAETFATATAAFPRRHGASFVDRERPTFNIAAVKLRYRIGRFLLGRHLNESKPFSASGIAVGDDFCRFNLTCLLKHLPQTLIRN
jgi:hypothetical protein